MYSQFTGVEVGQKSKEVEVEVEQKSVEEELNYQCGECGKLFNSEVETERHTEVTNKVQEVTMCREG